MTEQGWRTIGEVLLLATDWFKGQGIPTPRLDAEILVGHALGLPRLQVYLQHDRPLAEPELQAIRERLKRRASREPVAWITGEKEFYGLPFLVRPGVLVPRPDTETLVEALLQRIPEEGDPVYLADVGCGSGCVGLTVARHRARVRVYAIDLSREALECTRENAVALNLKDRVAILQGDLLGPVPAGRRVDWVVSNPPYIPTARIPELAPEVSRHEPRLALDGGADGLAVIRRLVRAARGVGGLALEVGSDQGATVPPLLVEEGFQGVTVLQDLARNDRVVVGTRG